VRAARYALRLFMKIPLHASTKEGMFILRAKCRMAGLSSAVKREREVRAGRGRQKDARGGARCRLSE